MRNVGRVFFSTLVTLALAVTAWSLPPSTTHGTAVLAWKNSFTLTVGSEKQNLQQDPGTPRTMTFLLDKNTTIEGSLRVGANADVTYRQDKGANVAISVHVTS